MVEPVTTSLTLLVLGKLAEDLLLDACKDHVKGKVSKLLAKLDGTAPRNELLSAYEDALKNAYQACLESLLNSIRTCGYSDDELRRYRQSLLDFVKDEDVAGELLEAIKDPEPEKRSLPSPQRLAGYWQALRCQALPEELGNQVWVMVAGAFRRQARRQAFLTPPLREILTAQNIDEIRRLLERNGGIQPEVRTDKYAARMRIKYAAVDLANLMPATAEDPGRMVIRDVLVPQTVRENPPPVEIPKDLRELLQARGGLEPDDLKELQLQGAEREELRRGLERLHSSYTSQAPRGVLELIADESSHRLVLIGEPGSGKSTLMRYLLLGVLERPLDSEGKPLPWTAAFAGSFPLLIELRDYYARHIRGECETVLGYAGYMGRVEQWFIDEQWLHQRLLSGPTLVMLDGLDEIFDRAERERVMEEIAGLGQRYPKARIVVTTRPVGYRETILRRAGFSHHGIQDLDDEQIEAFTRGWFRLTFPQAPELAEQRVERVLSSVRGSRPIHLLAGNPMLLTIMALLAREQELPRERSTFYEKAMEVLCHHWDANRNLQLPDTDYLTVNDKKALLQRVAMRMQTGPGGLAGNFIHEDDLEEEIAAWFGERIKKEPDEAILTARTMISTLRERNYVLCLRGPQLYGFVHRTFLEYLTAAEYADRFNRKRTLDPDSLVKLFTEHCRNEEWYEVLRLLCGQVDEQFVAAIIDNLVDGMDAERWDGRSYVPELVLTISLLLEVRCTDHLEDAGLSLLERTMQFMAKYSYPSGQRELMSYIVGLCEAIGSKWPGAHRYSFSAIALVENSYLGQLSWPKIVAALDPTAGSARFRELSLTRKLPFFRAGSLGVLASRWPDDETRRFLQQRASDDEDEITRSTALRALVDVWPDEQTSDLLRRRSLRRPEPHNRGAACCVLGGMHSGFGGTVFSRDLDRVGPFLDPLEPVTRDRIEEAARKVGIPADRIDEEVASLSAFLGWDITVGAREGLLNRPDSSEPGAAGDS